MNNLNDIRRRAADLAAWTARLGSREAAEAKMVEFDDFKKVEVALARVLPGPIKVTRQGYPYTVRVQELPTKNDLAPLFKEGVWNPEKVITYGGYVGTTGIPHPGGTSLGGWDVPPNYSISCTRNGKVSDLYLEIEGEKRFLSFTT